MFDKITDPTNGSKHSIMSFRGKNILENYVRTFKKLNLKGGAGGTGSFISSKSDLIITSSGDEGPLTNYYNYLINQIKSNGNCNQTLSSLPETIINHINTAVLNTKTGAIQSAKSDKKHWLDVKKTLTNSNDKGDIYKIANAIINHENEELKKNPVETVIEEEMPPNLSNEKDERPNIEVVSNDIVPEILPGPSPIASPLSSDIELGETISVSESPSVDVESPPNSTQINIPSLPNTTIDEETIFQVGGNIREFRKAFESYTIEKSELAEKEKELEQTKRQVEAQQITALRPLATSQDQVLLLESKQKVKELEEEIETIDKTLEESSKNLKALALQILQNSVISKLNYKQTKSKREITIEGNKRDFLCERIFRVKSGEMGEEETPKNTFGFKELYLKFNNVSVVLDISLKKDYRMVVTLKPKTTLKVNLPFRQKEFMFPVSIFTIDFSNILKNKSLNLDSPTNSGISTNSPDLEYILASYTNITTPYEYSPNRMFENFVYSVLANIEGLKMPRQGNVEPFISRNSETGKPEKLISIRPNTYHVDPTKENNDKIYFLMKLKLEGQWLTNSFNDNISTKIFICEIPRNYVSGKINIDYFDIRIEDALKNAVEDANTTVIRLPFNGRTILSHKDLGLSVGFCAIL